MPLSDAYLKAQVKRGLLCLADFRCLRDRRSLIVRAFGVICVVAALVVCLSQPTISFQGFSDPYSILNFPRKVSALVGYHYLGHENFNPPETYPIPVGTIGSVDDFSDLNAVNSNAGVRANIAHEIAANFGFAKNSYKVTCLAGLNLIYPVDDIPLPTTQQTLVTSALYVDTFDGREGAHSRIGASVDHQSIVLRSHRRPIGIFLAHI